MTPDNIAFHLKWRPASGHPRFWRLIRQDFRPGHDCYLQQLTGASDHMCYFKSYDAAQAVADWMNALADKGR